MKSVPQNDDQLRQEVSAKYAQTAITCVTGAFGRYHILL